MSASSALFVCPAPPAPTQEQLLEEPGAKVGFHRRWSLALLISRDQQEEKYSQGAT